MSGNLFIVSLNMCLGSIIAVSRLAEKYLKTSPLKLKFNPDWDPAGDEFSRAATAFKVGKDFEQSKKCLLRAVDCYKEVHSIFQAGKMLEQVLVQYLMCMEHFDECFPLRQCW